MRLSLRLQGKTFDVPEFNIPALSKLEDVKVGTKLEDTLKSLNASLPTLNEMRSTLNSLYVHFPFYAFWLQTDFKLLSSDSIETPFEAMSLKINQTTSNFTFTPSNATDTGPSVNSLAMTSDDLCSDLDLTFVDDAGRALGRIMRWGVGLLCAAGFVPSRPSRSSSRTNSVLALFLIQVHRHPHPPLPRASPLRCTRGANSLLPGDAYKLERNDFDDLLRRRPYGARSVLSAWHCRRVGFASRRRLEKAEEAIEAEKQMV
jgi:hypothetical protein